MLLLSKFAFLIFMKKLCLQLFDLMYAEQSKAGKISNLNYEK